MKKYFYPMLVMVLLIFGANSGVDAQSAVTITLLPSQWNIPQISCANETYCLVIPRVNHNNVLYLYDVYGKKLYIAQPDNSPAAVVDLSSALNVIGSRIFYDFIPFEDDTILFAGTTIGGVDSYYGLSTYNLQTQEVTHLNLPPFGRLISCNTTVTGPTQDFFRLGNGKEIVVCSVAENYFYNINRIDVATQTLEETIPTHSYAMGEVRVLCKIQVGMDGNLYIQGSYTVIDNLCINASLPQPIPDPNVFFYVVQHSPRTAAGSLIPVPKSIVSEIPSLDILDVIHQATTIRILKLVGVDAHSNLYIFLYWADIEKEQRHTDLFKLNSCGEILWHVTEADLGYRMGFEVLLGEDQFLIPLPDNQFQIIRVNAPTAAISDCPKTR